MVRITTTPSAKLLQGFLRELFFLVHDIVNNEYLSIWY